ncbi:MAG: ATP-binding protein, partial [Acidobacteria bacterium]|nr:ATP-binding protein [Acidobacteriota bacterium]
RAVRLLEEAQSVMGRELESREVEFRVRDESAGACVEVDPDQIRQLLLNLLNNALAAVQEMDSGASIELACRVAGGQVILEVIDNGRGMSEEERSKMFELFYSTRKGGTGLGLAIVERIAQAHDGRLEVESEVGRGTTVRLLLPRTAARPAEEPAAIPHRESEVPLESTG